MPKALRHWRPSRSTVGQVHLSAQRSSRFCQFQELEEQEPAAQTERTDSQGGLLSPESKISPSAASAEYHVKRDNVQTAEPLAVSLRCYIYKWWNAHQHLKQALISAWFHSASEAGAFTGKSERTWRKRHTLLSEHDANHLWGQSDPSGPRGSPNFEQDGLHEREEVIWFVWWSVSSHETG